ncbi:threonine aldolase [Vibrio galatheae]|uniref:Threonine aldolase n=1 Tax=Vibrio galatheae TaxID=579748 RepID=A0A0F4NID2_9VIBR|nr:beta-eliminating lyase-related protein [Vibrio galatheae]KJY82882.1 threonine aldolase [Vibrio galatheae]
MSAHLKQLCHTHLPGNKEDSPAEHFRQMAQWCEDNHVNHDVYGEGETIQAFEQKIADLLGYEAGLFVVTGTMTQPTVLELVTKQKRNPIVAMHPSSHVYVHERQGYQLQNRFNILPIGDPYQTWKLEDLQAWPDEIAAVLYELPMREIGGQLPSWDELEEIKSYCAEQEIHLHMDGARLWEAAAYYQKEYHQIAQGFDTTYVSLYKGVNGLGGSMLLGSRAFIDLAAMWMKRQGGNLYHRTPYIVSAAMQFDQRLARLPQLFERTKQVYQIIEEFPTLAVNPPTPQSNMLHLILPFSCDEAKELQQAFATEKGIWFGNPQVTGHPNQSVVEWYVGDNLLNLSDEELRSFFTELTTA